MQQSKQETEKQITAQNALLLHSCPTVYMAIYGNTHALLPVFAQSLRPESTLPNVPFIVSMHGWLPLLQSFSFTFWVTQQTSLFYRLTLPLIWFRTLLGCETHSTYTACRGGNFNAYLAYSMKCGGHPRRKPIYHLSHTGPVPMLRTQRDERLFCPG